MMVPAPFAINNAGQVVGTSDITPSVSPSFRQHYRHAFFVAERRDERTSARWGLKLLAKA